MSLEMKFLNSTQGLNIRALAARTWYGVLKIVILSLALGLWLNLGSVWAAPSATLLQTSLRDRLGELQQQISGYRVELRQLKDRQKTLESEIKFAGLEINKITRQIEATEVAIGISNAQVEELVAQINETEVELSRQRGILGHFLIILNEQDRESVAEALLTEESFQDFFVKYQTLMSLQGRMLQSVDKVQELKKGLELKQTEAEDQRAEEIAGADSGRQHGDHERDDEQHAPAPARAHVGDSSTTRQGSHPATWMRQTPIRMTKATASLYPEETRPAASDCRGGWRRRSRTRR